MDDVDYLSSMPFLALYAAMAVMLASAILIVVAHYFDKTGGSLTISIIITVAFVTATYASMVYKIQQTPLTEILVGGLATGLGGVVGFHLGRYVVNSTQGAT